MSAAPRSIQLQQTIAQLDEEIKRERGRLAEVSQAYKGKQPHKALLGENVRLRNLMTRRHALELERTYPSAQVLYEVTLWGVRNADGEAIEWKKEKRRADAGLAVDDSLRLVEVKTEKSIVGAVSGSLDDGKIDAKFRDSSKLGRQLNKEKEFLRWAKKQGVAVWVEFTDPVTLKRYGRSFSVEKVFGSLSQSYNNMGDGLNLSALFAPPAPAKPSPKGTAGGAQGGQSFPAGQKQTTVNPPPTSRTGVEPRALGERLTESKGTGTAEPAKEIRAFEPPVGRVETPRSASQVQGSKVQSSVDPGGVLAAGRQVQQGIEGGGLALFFRQLEWMNEIAREREEKAVERVMPEVEKWRVRGDWVVVWVTYAEPEKPDVLGYSPDSYQIVGGAYISHQAPPIKLDGKQVTTEEQVKDLLRNPSKLAKAVSQPPAMSVPPPAVGPRPWPPPGRVLVSRPVAIYPPLPPPQLPVLDLPISIKKSRLTNSRCTADGEVFW